MLTGRPNHMKKTLVSLSISLAAVAFVSAGEPVVELSASPAPKDPNSHDLFSAESTYTFNSDFKDEPRLGDGDSLYSDVSYDHRFLITGKWYFRLGAEYERF